MRDASGPLRYKPNSDRHLDEMFASIGGKKMYLRRDVDTEGEVPF